MWEESSLFHKKDAVPQESVSSRLRFVSGYIVTGGTMKGTAHGKKSSSPVGRATLSLSLERRAHFLALLLSQALPQQEGG